MTLSFKNIALALAASFFLGSAAHAQTSQSSSWSQSWSSSSGSSWGTRADGTTYQTGYSNSDSQAQASTTTSRNTPFGFRSNTTSVNQQQSSRNGYAASSGPGGIHQSAYSNNSGSTSLVNQRLQSGLLGTSVDTRSLNSQYSNQASIAQGIGPGGIYDNRYQSNSGSTTIGRELAVNSVFGPRVEAGSTRTVGFRNEQGINRGLNSNGLFNNVFNNQSTMMGGNDFLRVFP